uniref:Caspase 20, apoptosis-related cysteine peptidase n=1 Tax=Maylandia zebra TaxID=106582 RepID=A0A3P9DSR2_9CICH
NRRKEGNKRKRLPTPTILSGDHRLILNKVYENKLISQRDNLKSINSANAETHVIELVDKIMNKGEDKCKDFLNLLQTDGAIKETFPQLASLQLSCTPLLSEPVQVSSCQHDGNMSQDVYQIISRPVGLCVIINNNNFKDGSQRRGTYKDAQSLAEVFRCLGFRVLMFEDLNKDQMDQALTFVHGDAFICSILSHGKKGVVLGTDRNPLPIKEITRKFRGCDQSVLIGKPKVFLIQACQGSNIQRGVQMNDMEIDDDTSPLTIPEEIDGSWFVQSLCEQLKERCPRGEDIVSILHYVNDDVAHRETTSLAKQMPEVRFTLRKKLVLPPQCT